MKTPPLSGPPSLHQVKQEKHTFKMLMRKRMRRKGGPPLWMFLEPSAGWAKGLERRGLQPPGRPTGPGVVVVTVHGDRVGTAQQSWAVEGVPLSQVRFHAPLMLPPLSLPPTHPLPAPAFPDPGIQPLTSVHSLTQSRMRPLPHPPPGSFIHSSTPWPFAHSFATFI